VAAREAVKLSRRDLEERCTVMEGTVRRRALATAEELAAVCPGGSENPGAGLYQTVRHFGHLCAFLERDERSDPQQRAADAALSAALLELPKALDIVTTNADGSTTPWKVYPKSFRVLLDCDVRERIVQALTLRLDTLLALPADRVTPQVAQDLDALSRELARQMGMLAWIATTPGPGFPYLEGADPEPDPPQAVADLDSWDLWQVTQAWHKVNAERLEMTEVLLAPQRPNAKDGHQRPSWAVLFSTVGTDLDIDPARLMRDRSLVNVLATVRLGQPPAPDPKEQRPARAERQAAEAGA
jgi:hypothetical protein